MATKLTNQVNNEGLIPSTDVIKLTLTMKMTKGPVVIFVEGGGGKKRRGVKAISSDWVDVGAKLFYKEVYGVSSLIARCILREVHWPRWVKRLNSRAQTIFAKQ